MPDADKPHCYAYPRPAVTVDVVPLRERDGRREVLLILRGQEPFADCWANPGGFVDENEPLEAAARRELKEETGLADVTLTQVAAFGDPGRDPRGWTVTVAYVAKIDARTQTQAGDDAAAVRWFPVDRLPPLAFDHAQVIAACLEAMGA